jgi:hypothetical protein
MREPAQWAVISTRQLYPRSLVHFEQLAQRNTWRLQINLEGSLGALTRPTGSSRVGDGDGGNAAAAGQPVLAPQGHHIQNSACFCSAWSRWQEFVFCDLWLSGPAGQVAARRRRRLIRCGHPSREPVWSANQGPMERG